MAYKLKNFRREENVKIDVEPHLDESVEAYFRQSTALVKEAH
jgi:hypothetical protein